MATSTTPYGAFNFVVNFDGGELFGGFSDVSGIGTELTIAEYRNGNDRDKRIAAPVMEPDGPLAAARGGCVLLGDEVPLVDRDDQSCPLLPDLFGDPQVLCMHAQGGIDHEHAHVCLLDRPFGPQGRVELDLIYYFRSAP